MSTPELTINAQTGVHTISFAHGAGENNFELTLWTADCRTDGGIFIADPTPLGINLKRAREGNESRSSYDFSFNQAIMGDSLISNLVGAPDQTQTIKVRFCAVFDNKAADSGLIVNFEQFAITMTITIDGRFTVEDFTAQVREPGVDDENTLWYGVTARICNSPASTSVFNQGQAIEICICTPGAPAVRVSQVRSMQYTAGQISQAATDSVGAQQFLSIVRPSYEENGGASSCISVTSLPSEQFYQGSTAIPVVVTGRAVLEFPGVTRSRHLRTVTRTLQREEEQPFQLQLILVSDRSGAPYWTVALLPLMTAAALVFQR